MKANRFTGQVVLISGASSGIGLAAARAFAREGASLMLAARRLDRLRELAAALQAEGTKAECLETDVQDYRQAAHLVEATLQRYGRLDVLVNCAGVGRFGRFDQEPWESVQRTLRTNLEGAMALCHTAIPHMIRQRSGMIVNVSSVVGKRSAPLLATYCASKFGLWGFSQTLALELRPHGIQVCHFCPTSTATEFHSLAGMEQTHGSMHSPEQVALALVEAVVKRKSEHIMSLTERVLIKLHLGAPAFTDWLLGFARRGQQPSGGSS